MIEDRDFETRLRQLIEIGTTHNLEGIRNYKKLGGRVVGLMPTQVPEELLYAAGGLLPWHVVGSMHESTPLAGVHRSPATDAYTTHVIEALLSGELDFLDGLVTTNYDDDAKSVEYFSRFYSRPAIPYFLEIPNNAGELSLAHFTENLVKMKIAVEERFGTREGSEITDEKLDAAIAEYNTSRKLLHRLYEMRKMDRPPVNGSEVWAIVAAAMSVPQAEFIQLLEPLLPYIEQRQSPYSNVQARIMISGDFLHNVDYIKLVEDAGGLIAIDDIDVGTRYFWDIVDEKQTNRLRALAERYLGPMRSPRFCNWDGQADQIIEWIKEYRIDGFVELPVRQSLPTLFRSEYLHRTLEEEGIPSISIQREYHLADAAQITTRVEAFMEMLGQMNESPATS